ncbi:MAG: tryptophan synthase subunit beta [Fidelibacterota bacterium]
MKSLRRYILNRSGHFGAYGGRYTPEMLTPVMEELEAAFYRAIRDRQFKKNLNDLYRHYAGRPTPLVFCENLTQELGGARIYLKNEGLNHTGAHKMNHCLGQGLLARQMGKKRIIAETGAGQHGLATATVAARLGLDCTIYMGAKDYARQRPNVFWMEQLGATVVPVTSGGQILRDAINEALRDLIRNPVETHYLLGTVCGPHPYPVMNTWFQSVVGKETRRQFKQRTGTLPDCLVACVGGGSNAMGLFHAFLDEPDITLVGVEAGGRGLTGTPDRFHHAARFQAGTVGVVEGYKSLFLQDNQGQISQTHSISAGLDYSGVGPQLAYLNETGRLQTSYATDKEVLSAYELLARTEGIFAALESLHALAEVIKRTPGMDAAQSIIFNCSGRGDKDLFIVAQHFDRNSFRDYLKSYLETDP